MDEEMNTDDRSLYLEAVDAAIRLQFYDWGVLNVKEHGPRPYDQGEFLDDPLHWEWDFEEEKKARAMGPNYKSLEELYVQVVSRYLKDWEEHERASLPAATQEEEYDEQRKSGVLQESPNPLFLDVNGRTAIRNLNRDPLQDLFPLRMV